MNHRLKTALQSLSNSNGLAANVAANLLADNQEELIKVLQTQIEQSQLLIQMLEAELDELSDPRSMIDVTFIASTQGDNFVEAQINSFQGVTPALLRQQYATLKEYDVTSKVLMAKALVRHFATIKEQPLAIWLEYANKA